MAVQSQALDHHVGLLRRLIGSMGGGHILGMEKLGGGELGRVGQGEKHTDESDGTGVLETLQTT